MGLGLKFVPGEGPVFESPVQSEEAVVKLHVPDVGTDLKYVTDAVSSIRSALQGRVPLFGFSGSPFTLACYMIEGRGSRNFFTVKSMMYRRPDLFQKVISVNEKAVTEYLNARSKPARRRSRFLIPGAAASRTGSISSIHSRVSAT